MLQAKEQDKNLEKHLSEVEMGNLPGKEFRVIIVRMIQGLGIKNGGTDWEGTRINKELEGLKNKQMSNTMTEMKTTLGGINSRTNEAEERISVLEDRVEITAVEQNKEKKDE